MSEVISKEIVINNWTLTKIENQPEEIFIEDLVLARQLGYTVPRAIRPLIKRLIEAGDIKPTEVCTKLLQTTKRGGRPGTIYYLSERGAIKVAAHSETEMGKKLLDEIIDIFLLAKRGQLPPPPSIEAENKNLDRLIGGLAQLTQSIQEIVAAQASTQATLASLQQQILQQRSQPAAPIKPTVQPTQQAPLQPDLDLRGREYRWYLVIDVCRDLGVDFATFWDLWRVARCNNKYQRRQSRSGYWQIREDALENIRTALRYR